MPYPMNPFFFHSVPSCSKASDEKAYITDILCDSGESLLCVFITAVPNTKLLACVGGGTMEDMCYERLRATTCVG